MKVLSKFSLEGKVVAVTGAGRGIGRMIALEASRSGAKLAVGSRTLNELKSLAEEIEGEGGECVYHRLDVSDVDSIKRFTRFIFDRYGRLDSLVNNAGYNKQMKLLDYSEEEYDRIVDANLKSVFFCSQVAVREMIFRKQKGSIVNISSQAGVAGAPGRGPYSGAKGGVNNLTKTMAIEWAEHGIRVNVVAPTVTRSPLAEQAMLENQEFADAVHERNLLRRDLAEPEEVSAPVIFLASEAASMITGHTLVVDGGWTI